MAASAENPDCVAANFMDAIHQDTSHNTENQRIRLNTMTDDLRLDLICEI